MGGDRRSVLKPQTAWLMQLLDCEEDLTLAAIAARLKAERNVQADASMLSRFLRAQGLTLKKKPVCKRAGPARRQKAA
jgi:transposase